MDNQLENIKQHFTQLKLEGKSIYVNGHWWKRIEVHPDTILLRQNRFPQKWYISNYELLGYWRVRNGELEQKVLAYKLDSLGNEMTVWCVIDVK